MVTKWKDKHIPTMSHRLDKRWDFLSWGFFMVDTLSEKIWLSEFTDDYDDDDL